MTDFGSDPFTWIYDEPSPTRSGFPSLSARTIDFPPSTVASNGARSLLGFHTLTVVGLSLPLVNCTWTYASSCAWSGRLAESSARPAQSANRRRGIMGHSYGHAGGRQENFRRCLR